MIRLSAAKNLPATEAVALTTHRTADGTDHANVVLNDTHRASDGTDHANVVLNDTHRASDGTDHANVVLNDTHRASDGTDHANVVLNDTHRASDGTDHADVVTNTADIAGGKGPGVTNLDVAGALIGGPTTVNAFIATVAGTITGAYSKLGTGCAAGQTVDVDVQIAGVSCLTAATQHDNADGTNALAASIDGAANTLAAGNLVTMIWTEANAGGPTAADLTVTIAWRNT